MKKTGNKAENKAVLDALTASDEWMIKNANKKPKSKKDSKKK